MTQNTELSGIYLIYFMRSFHKVHEVKEQRVGHIHPCLQACFKSETAYRILNYGITDLAGESNIGSYFSNMIPTLPEYFIDINILKHGLS
jgi:hypothetical protein